MRMIHLHVFFGNKIILHLTIKLVFIVKTRLNRFCRKTKQNILGEFMSGEIVMIDFILKKIKLCK